MNIPKMNTLKSLINQVDAVDHDVLNDLLKKDTLLLRESNSKGITCHFYNLHTKSVRSYPASSLGTEITAILKKQYSKNDIEFAKGLAPRIEEVTRNPFEKNGLYTVLNENKEYDAKLNILGETHFRKNLESIRGDKEVDVIFKSIRKNDRFSRDGISFIEILIAHQTYGKKPIMGIPAIVADDRGTGKSTIATIGQFLYPPKNTPILAVNAGDGKLLEWGDSELEKRIFCYDDVALNFKDIIEPLRSKIKQRATVMGDTIDINVKGRGIKETNPYNQQITTNHKSAIPFDGVKDRRIYPIEIFKADWTDEELKFLDSLEFKEGRLRKQSTKLIQKILNHLKYVYDETKLDMVIYNYLNKRVPEDSIKTEILNTTGGERTLFKQMVSSTKTITSLVDALQIKYNLDDKEAFKFLYDCEIIEKKGKKELFLSTDDLLELGRSMLSDTTVTTKIAKKFGLDVKTYKINGSSRRGVKLPLLSLEDKKEELPYEVIIERVEAKKERLVSKVNEELQELGELLQDESQHDFHNIVQSKMEFEALKSKQKGIKK